MALIKCIECGKEISDKDSTCPNCGCPVSAQKIEPPMSQKKYCIKCGGIMNANQNYCNHCGYNYNSAGGNMQNYNSGGNVQGNYSGGYPQGNYNGGYPQGNNSGSGSKKDSPTAIVGCAFVLVSFFIFPFLSIVGVICGLIDLGTNDQNYRHLGGWVSLILGIIIMILWVERMNAIF